MPPQRSSNKRKAKRSPVEQPHPKKPCPVPPSSSSSSSASSMDSKHTTAAVGTTPKGGDGELVAESILKGLIERAIKASDKASDKSERKGVSGDGSHDVFAASSPGVRVSDGERGDGAGSPIAGESESDYVDRKADMEAAIRLLGPEFATFVRMFRSIPHSAREGACKLA